MWRPTLEPAERLSPYSNPAMHIHWRIERLDQGYDYHPEDGECLLLIEGTIEIDGKPAGLVDAFYLFTEDPESPSAFMEFWDLDATTCRVFEEISAPGPWKFREPVPALVRVMPGILCVNFIALRPPFRRRGLGREVMGEVVRNFADARVGMVLLNAQPLQHLSHGYDHFDEEVRDLPWNTPEEDRARLVKHFRTWGMQILPQTRFLLAAPEVLHNGLTRDWFPSLLGDD